MERFRPRMNHGLNSSFFAGVRDTSFVVLVLEPATNKITEAPRTVGCLSCLRLESTCCFKSIRPGPRGRRRAPVGDIEAPARTL